MEYSEDFVVSFVYAIYRSRTYLFIRDVCHRKTGNIKSTFPERFSELVEAAFDEH